MTAVPPMIDRLRDLAQGYDGFLLDLWGTLHDGRRLLPGAAACLAALRRRGRVCLISNAQRRASRESARLAALGVPADHYDGIVTAGEVCRARLAGDLGPGGRRSFWYLGLEENAALLDGRRFRRAAAPEEADLLLVCDPRSGMHDAAEYDGLLAPMLARGVPLVCPNPDRWSYWAGQRQAKPGAVAEHYAALGGRVLWYGKPHPAIYHAALGVLGVPAEQVLALGDGLETDIAGAVGAGVACCYIAGGSDAQERGLPAGTCPEPAVLQETMARLGVRPDAIVPSLRW